MNEAYKINWNYRVYACSNDDCTETGKMIFWKWDKDYLCNKCLMGLTDVTDLLAESLI